MQPESPNYWQPQNEPTPSAPPPSVSPPPAPVAPPSAVPEPPAAPAPITPPVPLDTPTPVAAVDQAPPIAPAPQPSPDESFAWQASEFVHHQKSGVWFAILAAVATVLLLIDVFLVKSWTFGALIVVMAVAVAVIGRREPRLVSYQLDASGLQVDDRHFGLAEFRAFGVVQEDVQHSVRLVPNKRFMPMVSVYLPADQAAEIVDVFGAHLPMEQIEPDPLERLTQRLRF